MAASKNAERCPPPALARCRAVSARRSTSPGLSFSSWGSRATPTLAVTLTSLADYKPTRLRDERTLALIVSTHGEGEPPDSARELHEYLHGRKAPRLGCSTPMPNCAHSV